MTQVQICARLAQAEKGDGFYDNKSFVWVFEKKLLTILSDITKIYCYFENKAVDPRYWETCANFNKVRMMRMWST